MEEVRQLVQEEGREARNLVAFHVAVDTPARVARKPPRSSAPPRRAAPRPSTRLRSASAGRDKRSELRARYWALLFGDLQRAIGEIYNTVEAHENLNECQEVILVLENYTRDFKALGEWFRLKWEYDNTPPAPERPQSLAWEIRKTDFVRPESRRTHSVKSSPSVSGKNSPCLSGHNTPSGKNSPNLTGKASPGSGKISPRITGHSSSPKANIEFFSSKISSKIATKPEPKMVKETSRLSDIKEKEVKELIEENSIENEVEVLTNNTKTDDEKDLVIQNIEIGKAKEHANVCPKPVIIKSQKRINQDTKAKEELSSQAKATIAKLDAMENEFLANQLIENGIKNDNMINNDKEIDSETKRMVNGTDKIKEENLNGTHMFEDSITTPKDVDKTPDSDEKGTNTENSPVKSEDNFADVSNESSPKSENETLIIETITNGEKISNHIKTLNKGKLKIKGELETIKICDENSNEKEILPIFIENNIPKEKEEKKELNQKMETKFSDTSKDVENKDEAKKDLEAKKPEPKRPAYSQAAAKPKQPTAATAKVETKTPTRLSNLTRSKTAVDMRPSAAPKTQRVPKRNQTNKCSYPFNLTTGRTSLFDTPASKLVPKKPINRPQMASGDAKLPPKVDVKKRPPRPTSLKINDKGDKKENINPALEKIKDCDEYSSSDTIVTQIDISRIESSESLKTLVPEEGQDVANSIEVLNVNKSDNEGWLTVKSKRLNRESKKQGRSHWANRFHQPSATTSLPTLNMIESPKQESKPIITPNPDRAKSEQPQNKPEKVVQVVATEKEKEKEPKQKDPAMIRQKSDVTGLKTRSKDDPLKSDKLSENDENDLTKNRLHSSLESLPIGLARSQESTEDTFDFDKWKEEFKFTFKYLDEDDPMSDDNELLRACDPSEMSEIAEMTSQIEENERKISLALDFQSEEDQRKLCEEEDLLNRQIMELQQVSDIDLDTETDDTETDAEILCEDQSATSRQSNENLTSLAASLEDQYETALAGMSWAERVDTLVVLEALVARDPGRAQQLHAKLSQGIKRRGSLQDALRRLQAKQARAERQRLEYQTERAKKIHQLLARVEEVKVAKNQLIEEKRLRMERRLAKAAENRDQHLKDIVRKAHDEEEKLREIAFIKQLEAENRRHEFLDQCRSQNTRLRQMRRERLDKLELKAAREAAVGARRQALEAARRLRVASLLQRRRERDARTRQIRERTQRERHHAAREKAEGVKSRLSALAAAAELEADALRSRIRDKQDASQQRLESHLQAIREKATGPRQPTTSESHDQASKEQKEIEEAAQRMEQERKEREKQKAIKKKARKVRQKLLASSIDVFPVEDSPDIHPPTKLIKVLNQISNAIAPLLENEPEQRGINGFEAELKKDREKKEKKKNNKKLCKAESVCSSLSDMSKGSGKRRKPRAVADMPLLEKNLNELHRMMDRFDKTSQDKTAFQKAQGLQVLGQLLAVASEKEDLAVQFSTKSLWSAVQMVSRLAPSAPRLLATSAPAHLARILSNQLVSSVHLFIFTSDPSRLHVRTSGRQTISIKNLLAVSTGKLKNPG
ncbi:LOW QUALITY PROTEIN: S phase cyclin A-associated protein in the endoplasmic reticulum [Manduca sexta]|uniref:LOW QUALITY PROTEIN: S phase cyclin A-associated protein in the endoplasmic reticulum n=1 Tax=Manduca sexta TaxID=7130 RepID=UPI00188E7EE3|nr:LOW QUALITY PROTEIN: S phase cyclin A-associated protein in the endoplasmic reticulum [Manduca sexta]